MRELFMYAGIITAIVLCFVGIIKLPFNKFKTSKPKLYKATFTLLSIVASIGGCVIVQLYVLNGVLLSTNFVVMLLSTFAGVFGLYSSYEGLGLKELVKKLITKIKELANKAPESKFAKYVDKIGLDKALEIVNNLQVEKPKEVTIAENNIVKVEEVKEVPATANVVESVVVEATPTVEENKPIAEDHSNTIIG